MTCTEARHLVEAIASGDLEVEETIREHFETCPQCAAMLASARRLESALQARDVPLPPARFTANVLARVRQEQWQSEQHVDRIFNVGIVVAVLLVVGGVLALTNAGATLGAAGAVGSFLARFTSDAVQDAAPTLTTYVAAVGLLMSALAMWWWADRRLSL